ncbi:hypothetical protein RI054_26g109930 [Pseudoscourfieldia marina]
MPMPVPPVPPGFHADVFAVLDGGDLDGVLDGAVLDDNVSEDVAVASVSSSSCSSSSSYSFASWASSCVDVYLYMLGMVLKTSGRGFAALAHASLRATCRDLRSITPPYSHLFGSHEHSLEGLPLGVGGTLHASNLISELVKDAARAVPCEKHVLVWALKLKASKLGDDFNADDEFAEDAAIAAAEVGNVESLRTISECGAEFDDGVVATAAAREGHVDVLRYLVECARRDDDGVLIFQKAFVSAAASGHVNVLAYVVGATPHDDGSRASRRVFGDPLAATLAARGGHKHVLEFLLAHGIKIEAGAATAAAEQGRLEILQWIYEKCAIMPRDVGLKAAHRGHIPILEFALRSGLKMTKYTARFAVYSGQLNVLRWLVEVAKVSIEEDDEIVALAATYGHIPILEYAVLDKRCTCDHAAYRYVRARAKDQPDVLRWIDEHADMLCYNIR